ncbi:hypothetical protein [Pseudomonas flexibilis]|uniref:capsular polysaccharide export protein, LipB/KpsS family n=1 Tax=Pseudomonas flexibilis TaxID=706570 RepID=UPI0008762088|nr:hypothetical protein [Pseudomonas flexibilis]SCY47604.1 Capsule polysaccharide biosynthesis protein [Pseudomonas flexibilis]
MANICFTVLHYRVPFVYALSVELERRGHSVFFLCPSPKWRDWLLAKGISKQRILDQTVAIKGEPLSEVELSFFEEIREAERRSNLTLNSMILMDRLVREWNSELAYNYLVRLYVLLKRFIPENKIDMVIGEATPANELLTSVVCESINVPYYFPITVRIPDNRFAFFKGRFHNDFALRKNIAEEDSQAAGEWAGEFLSSFEQRKPKPSYWHKNNKLPKFQVAWLYKFFKTLLEELKYKKSDPTRFNLSWLLKKRMGEVVNRYRLRCVKFQELSQGESFVLYPLHKQPESSVDVLGDFYSDQLNLIKQIVRSLPAGYKLYVKEHSNAIGDRPLSFYREVERLPNAKLISPKADSFHLLKFASLVVTVSGTMAYEAGLLGRPVITFSDMFFSKLPSVRYCAAVRSLPEAIFELIGYVPGVGDEEEKLRFLKFVHENSFEGTFSDVNAYPEVIEETNINKVANAVEAVV